MYTLPYDRDPCIPVDSAILRTHVTAPRAATKTTSMIPEILLLVEQIRPTTTQIYNLRTSIPVLLQARTLEAVEGV